MVFERRRPRAREVVLIAMMCAMTTASQVVLHIFLPVQIGTALIILSGISLGPEAGFLIGALSRLVCNFYMGQGPWTPWQMFCWGILGFLAGFAFHVGQSEQLHARRFAVVAGPVLTMALALAAAAAVVLLSTKVERADYNGALRSALEDARSLLTACSEKTGNGEGQYAPFTLEQYETDIAAAQAVLDDQDSSYTARQSAYQTLSEQTDRMKDSANRHVVTADEVQALADEGKTGEYTVSWEGGEVAVYIAPDTITAPADLNLDIGRGPNISVLQASCDAAGLQGPLFSLYHDGAFGATVPLDMPVEDGDCTGALYHYDPQAGKLILQADTIKVTGGKAVLEMTQGGDYLLALRETAKPTETAAPAPTAAPSLAGGIQGSGGVQSSGTVQNPPAAGQTTPPPESSGDSGSVSSPAPTPVSEVPAVTPLPSQQPSGTISVTLEIRCDPLAQDPSRLKDPSKQTYVPADGTILGATTLQVREGSTVFDVLTAACRDNNIQIEYSYYSGFQSYYIEGINHLYEFDGGQMSGWLYRVNGVFPSYGCSAYTLKEGDSIALLYTCDGGADVGNPWPQ